MRLTRQRAAVLRAVVLVIGVFVGLGISEVLVRLLAPRPPAFPGLYAAPHAVLGWFNVPGREGWYVSPEFKAWVKINSKGLRDREYAYEKQPGVFRILVLGDSMAKGAQVELEDSFPKRLESTLNRARPGRPVEVINAGVGGWGTSHQLLFFQHEGHKYQPDLVLLAFCPCNDITDNDPELTGLDADWGRAMPFFFLSPEGLRLEYRTTVATDVSAWKRGMGRVKRVLRQFQTYDLARAALIAHASPVAATLVHLGVMEHYKQAHGWAASVYTTPYPPEVAHAWEVTRRLVRMLNDSVVKRGARLLVTVVPAPEQADPEARARVEGYLEAGVRIDPETPNRELAAFLRQEGIAFVDVLPSFRASLARTQERGHFRRDGHLTAAGHRATADAIDRFLAESSLLETTP